MAEVVFLSLFSYQLVLCFGVIYHEEKQLYSPEENYNATWLFSINILQSFAIKSQTENIFGFSGHSVLQLLNFPL